jgi:hypothetical protein
MKSKMLHRKKATIRVAFILWITSSNFDHRTHRPRQVDVADRLIERTGGSDARDGSAGARPMDLERERGITIRRRPRRSPPPRDGRGMT